MTFTQTPGNPVSFIGTDSNDVLVLTAGQPFSGVINPEGTYDGSAVWVQAEAGADIVTTNGNAAGVTIYGGAGNDDVDANGNGQAGQFTNGQVFLDDGDDLFTYNNLVTSGVNGGNGNDTIIAGSDATSTASSINGNAGDDFLFVTGRAGDTGIYGGQGADSITVSTGTFVTSSVINGNRGTDFINIDTTGASASAWRGTEVRGGADNDTIQAISGTANLGGVYGDLGNDRIVGTVVGELSGGNPSYQRASDGVSFASTVPFQQQISAYSGELSLFGGDGNDNIQGGSADDTIDGGFHADVINGRAGDDTLTGGGNTYSDVFVFGNGTSIFTLETNNNIQTQVIGLETANGFLNITHLPSVFSSIDNLIGSDVVTDFDLAVDGIQISNSTFFHTLARDPNFNTSNGNNATNGANGTVNSGYRGDFGVSSDGDTVTWFNSSGRTATPGDDAYGLIYDQSNGSLYYVAGVDTSIADFTFALRLANIRISKLNDQNSHLIATLEGAPDINGSNYSNIISIIN